MTEGSRTLAQVIRDLFSSGKKGVNTLIGKIVDIKEAKVKAEDGQEYELLSSHRQPVKGDIAVFIKTVDGLLYALTGIVVEKTGKLIPIPISELIVNIVWAFRTLENGFFGLGSKVEDEETKLIKYLTDYEEEYSSLTEESLDNLLTTYFTTDKDAKVFLNSHFYSNGEQGVSAYSGDGKMTIVQDGVTSIVSINTSLNALFPALTSRPEYLIGAIKKDLSVEHTFIVGSKYVRYAHRVRSKQTHHANRSGFIAAPVCRIKVNFLQTGQAQMASYGWNMWRVPGVITFSDVQIENFDSVVSTADMVYDSSDDINNRNFLIEGVRHTFNDGAFVFANSFSFSLAPEEEKYFAGFVSLSVVKPNFFYNDDAPMSGDRVFMKKLNAKPFSMTLAEIDENYGIPWTVGYTAGHLGDNNIALFNNTVLYSMYCDNATEFRSLISQATVFALKDLIVGHQISGYVVIPFNPSFPYSVNDVSLSEIQQNRPTVTIKPVTGDTQIKVVNKLDEEKIVFEELIKDSVTTSISVNLNTGVTSASDFDNLPNVPSKFHARVGPHSYYSGVNYKSGIFNNVTIEGKRGLFTALLIPPGFEPSVSLTHDFLIKIDYEPNDYTVCRLISAAIMGSFAIVVLECVDKLEYPSVEQDIYNHQFYASFPTNTFNYLAGIRRRRKFVILRGECSTPEHLGSVITVSDSEIVPVSLDSRVVKVDDNGLFWYEDTGMEVDMNFYTKSQPYENGDSQILPRFNAEYGPVFVHMAKAVNGDDAAVLLYCDKENEDDEKYIQKAIILS